jgi:hypothetical protein
VVSTPQRLSQNREYHLVAETIFGVSINAQASNGNYSHTFDRLMEIMFLRVFRVIYKFDFIFRWTQDCKDQRQIIDKIKNVSRDLIRKKKEQLGFQTEIEGKKIIDVVGVTWTLTSRWKEETVSRFCRGEVFEQRIVPRGVGR